MYSTLALSLCKKSVVSTTAGVERLCTGTGYSLIMCVHAGPKVSSCSYPAVTKLPSSKVQNYVGHCLSTIPERNFEPVFIVQLLTVPSNSTFVDGNK